MVTVCSRHVGRLLAVPISRYSYPDMGFRDTFAYHTLIPETEEGVFCVESGNPDIVRLGEAGRPPRLNSITVTDHLKHPFGTSSVVCG